MDMDKLGILSRISLFERISTSSRQALADICMAKNIKKRDMLFREGGRGTAVFILVTGSVQLYKKGPDGREIVIKVVQPGEMFAEVVLFEKAEYPVSAVALKNSLLFVVPKPQFLELLRHDDFLTDFMGNLMAKLRFLAEQIKHLTSHDVEDRFFIFVEQHFGKRERVIPGISKKDTAKAIGTTPETLSRLILRLGEEGKLRWDKNGLAIPGRVWEERREREQE